MRVTILVAMIVATVSWATTGMLRRYALVHKILDIPNERSSHSAPTPRGGGLAFVIVFLGAILGLTLTGFLSGGLVRALLGGGLAVAVVGLFDDYRHVPAGYRLVVHFVAVGWAVYCLGGLPPVNFGFTVVNFGVIGTVLTICYLVWFLNLYNFMDGTDGIASVEAICIAGSAVLLIVFRSGGHAFLMTPLLLVAAVAGFLVWNWPPARIFMGDVGSGFLGFVLGVFAIETVTQGVLPLWAWLILFGCFFVDATVTLLRRLYHRERVYEAHRSHAYQHLSRYWGSHLRVTLLLLGINVFWLLPLAVAATIWPKTGVLLTILAWLPLAWGTWRLGAGLPGDLSRSSNR